MELSAMQKDAYIAVLRAFHVTKSRDWSHPQLLRSLREGLSISQDQHIACLGCVLRDNEASKDTAPKEKAKIKTEKPSMSGTAEPKRKTAVSKTEKDKHIKKQKVKNRDVAKMTQKSLVASSQSQFDSNSSEVVYIKLTPELIHGLDESGLNYLYGRELETYWEEVGSIGKWYSAFVTDYNPEKREHRLSYDYGTSNETFEEVHLDELLKKGNVRFPKKEHPLALHSARSEKCGDPPFDDIIFEKMLREGTREELQWMLASVQAKMLHLCTHIKPPKHPATEEEVVVSKLVSRGHLISAKHEEMKILL